MEKYGIAMVKTCWKKANEDDEKDDYSSIHQIYQQTHRKTL